MAQSVADNPSGTFPEQMPDWGALKAAYRLFDRDEVTFESIAEPHWEQTRASAPGRYLILGDTTELDFGWNRDVDGLQPVGNGSGNGFLLHNALMIDAETEAVIGLAGQKIHYRKSAPKNERRSQRLKRDRESAVWTDVIEQIGHTPEESGFVHVYDRGGDNFEVYCKLKEHNADWVIRASATHRVIVTPDGQELPLGKFLKTLPVVGAYELDLRSRPGQRARTAKIDVQVGTIKMPLPRQRSPYLRSLNPQPIQMHVVRVREADAPAGVTPIEWVLYTSLPVKAFEDAWNVIRYYECRWLIEEYHKALKSGCRVQDRQLRLSTRLEAVAGLLSVVAVRLLQLKTVAREDPDRPAKQVVPHLWLQMLKAARKKLRRVHDLTIYEFYREVAKLGGFLGRKSDGEPGWITIWRGWETLNTLVRGAELALELPECG